jgi:N-acetylmuramoyl-L-alanine amidase
MPLRVLVGANMPAVLIEMGYLTNAEDEKALTAGDLPNRLIDALLATISDARRGIPDADVRPPRP